MFRYPFTLERGELSWGLVRSNGAGNPRVRDELRPIPATAHRAATLLLIGGAWGNALSGGERTRAAISKLSGSPSLLLLDEPTNHLDLDSVRHLIQRLRDLDCAVLIVSRPLFSR